MIQTEKGEMVGTRHPMADPEGTPPTWDIPFEDQLEPLKKCPLQIPERNPHLMYYIFKSHRVNSTLLNNGLHPVHPGDCLIGGQNKCDPV